MVLHLIPQSMEIYSQEVDKMWAPEDWEGTQINFKKGILYLEPEATKEWISAKFQESSMNKNIPQMICSLMRLL